MIARTVLGNPNAVVLASMAEIAELSGTSEAAVSRLARRLGYSGFPEFRVSLAQNLVVGPEYVDENVDVKDSIETIIRKTTASNIRALSDTEAVLDPVATQKAADLLWHAKRIAFLGVGGSAIVARDAYHKFLRTGRMVVDLTDTHEQMMFAALSGPDDVLVVVSHSGGTAEVLATTKIALQRKARVIAVTHYGRPPLARIADVYLGTSSVETRYRPEAITSRIAALNILDILYSCVAVRMDGQMASNLEAIRTAVGSNRI